MRSNRSRGVALALLCTMALLPACGKAAGTETPPLEMGVESGFPDDPQPERGGRLVYGLEGESSEGFCLSSATLAMSGLQVVRSIYDHLTIPDGAGGYVPYLAKTVEPDATNRVWTITLRPDITFHDGLPLDAAAVKANLDAYRGVEGDHARDSLLFAFTWRHIESVEVVNDLTLRVTTAVPQSAFPGMLYSSGRFAIMSPTQLNASPEDCARKPIGTGPFVFSSWEVGERMVLNRNPDYWLIAPDGEPYPYLDSVEFRPTPNNDARIASLREGDLNMMHTSSAADMVGSLEELRDAGAINMLVSDTQTEVTYAIVNTSRPGLDNQELRVAAAQALDLDRLNELGNGGFADPARGPFGPDVMGYLDDNGYPGYDPEAARATVERLRAEGVNTSFKLLTPDNPSNLRLTVIAQQMLRDAGIEVELEVEPEPVLIERVIAGDFDVAAFRNHPGEDPDLNYVWWYGDGNPVNFGRFDDPVINENLDLARSSDDPDERRAAYEAVNRQFGSEVWNIWLFRTLWALASASNVHGMLGPDLPNGEPATSRIVNGHPLTGVWIDRDT